MQAVNSSISNSSSKTRTIIFISSWQSERGAQRSEEKRKKEKSNFVERRAIYLRENSVAAVRGVGFVFIAAVQSDGMTPMKTWRGLLLLLGSVVLHMSWSGWGGRRRVTFSKRNTSKLRLFWDECPSSLSPFALLTSHHATTKNESKAWKTNTTIPNTSILLVDTRKNVCEHINCLCLSRLGQRTCIPERGRVGVLEGSEGGWFSDSLCMPVDFQMATCIFPSVYK
jgi:hypothetical protein